MVFGVAVGDEIDAAVTLDVGGLKPGADADGPAEVPSLPESPRGVSSVHDEEIAVRVVETVRGSHFATDNVGEAVTVEVACPDVLGSIQTLDYQMLTPEIAPGVGWGLGPENSRHPD